MCVFQRKSGTAAWGLRATQTYLLGTQSCTSKKRDVLGCICVFFVVFVVVGFLMLFVKKFTQAVRSNTTREAFVFHTPPLASPHQNEQSSKRREIKRHAADKTNPEKSNIYDL